jgi:hypothetical protein
LADLSRIQRIVGRLLPSSIHPQAGIAIIRKTFSYLRICDWRINHYKFADLRLCFSNQMCRTGQKDGGVKRKVWVVRTLFVRLSHYYAYSDSSSTFEGPSRVARSKWYTTSLSVFLEFFQSALQAPVTTSIVC